MSDRILKIVGRYIYDSRGNPTVEVDLWTTKGIKIHYFFEKRTKKKKKNVFFVFPV